MAKKKPDIDIIIEPVGSKIHLYVNSLLTRMYSAHGMRRAQVDAKMISDCFWSYGVKCHIEGPEDFVDPWNREKKKGAKK